MSKRKVCTIAGVKRAYVLRESANPVFLTERTK